MRFRIRSSWGASAIILLLAAAFSAPTFAAEQITEGTACILEQPAYTADTLNCTAGDIGLSTPVAEVIDACDYPGDTARLKVIVDITTTANTRYDMGLWFAVDGDPNGDGAETGICTVVTIPNSILDADGISTNIDLDFCGDVVSTAAGPPDIVGADLGVFDLPCIDTDGDGFINVPLIVAYSNRPDPSNCSTAIDAVPDNKSKCSQNLDAQIPIPVPARIIVTKDTVPDDTAAFDFNLSGPTHGTIPAGGFTGSHNFQLADTEEFDSATFNGGLVAGTGYSVTETPNAAYQSSGVCSSDVDNTNTDPANLTLRAGETVTCDFTNVAIGTVAIIKKTLGNPSATFSFTSTDVADFDITTVDGTGDHELTGLSSGTYVITESAKAGWDLTDLSCVGGTTSVDQPGRSVTITLTGTETVSCTFENTERGQIEILKTTDPVSTDTFSFTHDAVGTTVPASPFDIDAGSAELFLGVVPGTILVTENDPATAYDLSDLECVDGDPTGTGSTWNVTTRVATINLDPGETVVCTYTNTKRASLTLVKTVTNDNGGTAGVTDWTLSAAGTTPLSGHSGQTEVTAVAVVPGDYILSESTGPAGYTAGSWVCTDGVALNGSTVTLAPGDVATCTINNDDDAAKLTLIKQVINDNGGTAPESAWTLSAGANDVTGSPTGGVATDQAGTYALSESTISGYSLTSLTCDNATGPVTSVTVGLGETVACTFVNDDDAAILTLVKTVTNNNGGAALVTDWTLNAAGPTPISGQTATAAVTAVPVDAGVYTLSETAGPTGYDAEAWSCSAGTLTGDQLTLANGESATCSIHNDDAGPGLTLIKAVRNDNGGTKVPADFALHLNGGAYDGSQTFASGDAPATHANVAYTLSETPVQGYTETGIGCVDNTTLADVGHPVTLNLRQAVTCTISNDDDAATLALVKSVTNDNGGTAASTDWTLSAAGPTPISGVGGVVATPVSAGTYTLSESTGPAGYTAGAWSCTGGSLVNDQLTLALGESASCTIVNDDNAASLALIKSVTNDNGGTAVTTDWTLSAAGPTPLSGAGGVAATPVSAGTYTLSESAGPAGYTAGAWSCTAGSLTGSSLVLALGETAACTIINDDDGAILTLVKTVTNNNGGTALATNWTLNATGPTPISGQTATPAVTDVSVDAGVYTLSETAGPAGYDAGAWFCSAGTLAGDQLTLANGESATCSIHNDDAGPGLTLMKAVKNDNGGSLGSADFVLHLTGGAYDGSQTFASGDAPATHANVAYTLSETPVQGYTEMGIVCVDNTTLADVGHPVTLNLRQAVTCTISNDDDAATLALVKSVTNDNGGTAASTDWTLSAAGPTPISGAGGVAATPVSAGTYTLSESAGPAGYTAGAWSCTAGSFSGSSLVLALGETAVCTIINDDAAASLTLVKTVINDGGGTSVVADWMLTATGPTTITGKTNDAAITAAVVDAGVYTLSESGPAGYTASAWSCIGGILVNDQLTLASGESASCTISNDDVDSAILTLIKSVTNDDGGSAVNTDWTLSAQGPTPISGVSGDAAITAAPVDAGVYTLAESNGPTGYTPGDWSCTAGALVNDQLTLASGEDASCTINNDDNLIVIGAPVPVPVNDKLALLLLTLMLLAAGWYFRPTIMRKS